MMKSPLACFRPLLRAALMRLGGCATYRTTALPECWYFSVTVFVSSVEPSFTTMISNWSAGKSSACKLASVSASNRARLWVGMTMLMNMQLRALDFADVVHSLAHALPERNGLFPSERLAGFGGVE